LYIRKEGKQMDLKIVCEHEKYMPQYANETDACMDLKIKIPNGQGILQPNEMRIWETGCKFSIPEGYVMLIFPRSSTGIKLQCMLANTTGIIDSGFRGTVKMALFNFGKEPIEIQDGRRIAQFMVIPRPQIQLKLVNDDENFRQGDRGGGIGSTGAL
jgi:dUTP pyrophosphatase